MFKSLYVWLLIAAVFLLSIQIVAVIIYIYSFIPYPSFWSDPFLKGVEPQRQSLFYAVFLFTAVILMVLSVKWVLPQLRLPENLRKFKFWLVLESVWCFLIFFSFFKWATYRYPFWNILPYENSTWLQPFFVVICSLALLSKIFFPEIDNFFIYLKTYARQKYLPRLHTILMQIIFVVGVILLLYVPKPQEVTALSLLCDQWNHWDHFTGWFIAHGWYLNYEASVQIVVITAIIYVIGIFYFIRLWLHSWGLAVIGALLTIKMGMFYYGAAPCIWINPAHSFLGHGWDIFLFFGLWFVSVKYPSRFYLMASLIGMALVILWFKSMGYVDALGLDNQPMMAPLRVRQFFPFFMGYLVPVFYIFSLLILMGQAKLKNASALRLPIVICIYGLMIFVDYLERPVTGFYGALMVPAIFVMLWWLAQWLSSSRIIIRRSIYAGIFLLVLGALLTNRLMLVYPNIFENKERFSQETSSYQHFDGIASSASLIRQLIPEGQKVVLLSNFETALLMKAQRQPVFDHFPVMFSNLNKGLGGLDLKTREECLRLINQMEGENAFYIFVDGRLWDLSPQVLGDSGLNAVWQYIKNHYQFYKSQGFLVALQRRT